MVQLPVTLISACVLALILLWLSVRVIGARVSNDILIGDGGAPDALYKIRTHGNFTEYTPLFLILLGLLELNGGQGTLLLGVAALFILGRVLHVFGMGADANLKFRQAGMASTFLSLIFLSLYGLYLGLSG